MGKKKVAKLTGKSLQTEKSRSKSIVKEKDFIKIDFTGRDSERRVFDTTSASVARESGIFNEKASYEPFSLCVGQGYVLFGLDKALVGKLVGQKFSVKLGPEEAFGKRNPKLVKTLSLGIFREKELEPRVGMAINLNGMLATVRAVTGGRVIVDFNNPLSGREVFYDVKVKSKISSFEERLSVVVRHFFRTDRFKILNGEVVLEKEFYEKAEKIISFFKKKVEKLLGKKVAVKSGKI